jgi:uncharacterized protein YbjT (DUF2867 family)
VATLVVGATGLIGSALVGRLVDEGHDVAAVVRANDETAHRLPARLICLNVANATRPGDWLPHLTGIEAVVNCAGVLQETARDSVRGVHVDGASALFAACERLGIRRVVHLSAIGADRAPVSTFSATKRAGEEALMRCSLDWVILRPSVVVGRAAYGGSALFRGLAALPLLPSLPSTGPLQVVQLEDLLATVIFFLRPDAPARMAVDIAGPDRLPFDAIIASYRRWLGWRPARVIKVPSLAARLLYFAGDCAGWLGWRPPVRTTAAREITRGAIGDPGPWTELTGITPRSLPMAQAAEPASVQERWFALLYLIKPVVFVVFPAFWILTGLISLGPGFEIGKNLMLEAGAGRLSGPSVIVGALADIAVGVAIAFRRTARIGLYGALAISIFYFVVGSILVPRLWAEPLGPLLKIWPIIGLNLVMLAILRER